MNWLLIVGVMALAAEPNPVQSQSPATSRAPLPEVQEPPATTQGSPSPVTPPTQTPPTPALGLRSNESTGRELMRSIARVGNEEITLQELSAAYKEWEQENVEKLRQMVQEMTKSGVSPADQDRELRSVQDRIYNDLLREMIDRKVVMQEFKHRVKDPKKWDMIMKKVNEAWVDDKLPHLLKIHGVADEAELAKRLELKGRTLDELKENFRQECIVRDFVRASIGNKIQASLPEKEAYYRTHINEYEAPANVTWRELVAPVDAKTTRAMARKKAEMWLARLQRGEDFKRIAQTESQGATASKGGLWEKMRVGSYAIPAVSAQLETLPIGQTSAILEGPDSFHVIRVEARRGAGPLRFYEVQDKVTEALQRQKLNREYESLLEKLRSRAFITTFVDGLRRDANLQRASGTMPQPR
jgi:hypothetical protein